MTAGTTSEVLDRKRGCMYGLAVGDALGAPIEMKKPGTFEPISGYRSSKHHAFNHGLGPGEWTDDTSMALALADAISASPLQLKQIEAYADWYQNGKYGSNGRCVGIGSHTRRSIEGYLKTGSPVAKPNDEALGNGTIMRLAPIPIKFSDGVGLVEAAVASAETTHNNDMSKSACKYMAVVIAGLIRGLSKETVLDKNWIQTSVMELHPVIRGIADGDFLTVPPTGIGHVAETLRSALWAFMTTNTFEECVLKAINLGNDADTTGAVAGQFAGACYGYNAIPEKLIAGLAKKEMIDEYLNKIMT